ncbi:hypothetical protein CVT25_008846 [Psilocybe cyanescens]|uniref:Uncharacterized protein n=1 Tax=Psilocybe cyanescens TaxID=93625 RepID=A0A409XAG6_PSICY|nr:hypothetical protein CVT25_008846 [Psilocybe cyanescens]
MEPCHCMKSKKNLKMKNGAGEGHLLWFLNLVQPFLPIIPEASSPDLKILVATNPIYVNFSVMEDRALFSAQKLFALIIALGQGTIYELAELYGQPSDLGASVCPLFIIAALILTPLNELLQKGYDLGSGINLFIPLFIPTNI